MRHIEVDRRQKGPDSRAGRGRLHPVAGLLSEEGGGSERHERIRGVHPGFQSSRSAEDEEGLARLRRRRAPLDRPLGLYRGKWRDSEAPDGNDEELARRKRARRSAQRACERRDDWRLPNQLGLDRKVDPSRDSPSSSSGRTVCSALFPGMRSRMLQVSGLRLLLRTDRRGLCLQCGFRSLRMRQEGFPRLQLQKECSGRLRMRRRSGRLRLQSGLRRRLWMQRWPRRRRRRRRRWFRRRRGRRRWFRRRR